MVKRAALPYIEGLDFRAEFYREEREELDGFSFDERTLPAKTQEKKEKMNRKHLRTAKRSSPPLPIPPAEAVKVGKPAKARKV